MTCFISVLRYILAFPIDFAVTPRWCCYPQVVLLPPGHPKMTPESSQNDPRVIPKVASKYSKDPQVTPVTFMTCMSCMSCMSCMHFMHVMHACHASLARVLNLANVAPAQPVPSRRISGSIFEPGAKDLPPLEAILFNCLPPAVIVGLAHPYRQDQCFRACGVVLGEILAQSCLKTATSVPPAQSVRGRCPF